MKSSRKTRDSDPAISRIIALAACLMIFAPAVTHAQTVNTTGLAAESKGQKDVDIESDQMQIKEVEKLAIFTGNVDARRGNVKLKSDKLVVHYDDAKKKKNGGKTEVTHLDATGHVVIITRNQRITGNWAKMDVKANLLNVGGNVVVTQGKTVVKGKKLFVDLNTNVSKFSGGRVKGSFVPSGN
ncbi:MAG: LptA/OstA family protein [Hyphomicrobiales bacterium]|nr:LptA/OstA family protein [Hyphomicrobiales bacterium]